jgi:60 kDa SS-A/Ro ribonucleoprotein
MSRALKTFGRHPKRSESAPITTRDPHGSPAWNMPVEEAFVQTLTTNTLGNTFYATQREMMSEADRVVGAMLDKDPAFAAKAIVYARQEGYMRTLPTYALVRLWETVPGLAAAITPLVLFTPNDLRDFTAMRMERRRAAGKSSIGGRMIKSAIGAWMCNRVDEYRAVKYGAEGHAGYSLRDMLRIYHPGGEGTNAVFNWIMSDAPDRTGKRVRLTGLPMIKAYEALKKAETATEMAKLIETGGLPHEVTTAYAGSSKVIWNAIVRQLPIFALIKNLAALERHGVLEDNWKWICDKLTDAETIRKSKILPFRFVTAMEYVTDTRVKDALRGALDLAFDNVPTIEGRTAVALDISGSMGPGYHQDIKGCPAGGFIRVAALFGVGTMRKANLNGKLYLFNTHCKEFPVSMHDSIATQADRITAHGGTDTGCVVRRLIERNEKYDNIVVITDEQQNSGRPLVDILDEYRQRVNRKVRLFIVDVAPYGTALVPASDTNTYYCFGWSEAVLRYMALASKGWGSLVDAIRAGTSSRGTPEIDAYAEANDSSE